MFQGLGPLIAETSESHGLRLRFGGPSSDLHVGYWFRVYRLAVLGFRGIGFRVYGVEFRV